MQALLTMSAFVLVPGGDAKIRSMQQQLNHDIKLTLVFYHVTEFTKEIRTQL